MNSEAVYPPLDILKAVATDSWIVDSGPFHAMGFAIPVRMTVIRLTTVGWASERVVFAHGRWFDVAGSTQLRRSLRWLIG